MMLRRRDRDVPGRLQAETRPEARRPVAFPAVGAAGRPAAAGLLLALAALACACARAGETVASGVVVRLWQSQDGLPGNVVRSVVQSPDGFLWVATAEGVARFDGHDFVTIKVGTPPERPPPWFSRLFAEPTGRIWAATSQGGLWRVDRERLVEVLPGNTAPRSPHVTQLVTDGSGTVWVRRGTETLRVATGGRARLAPKPAGPDELFARDMEAQSRGGRRFEPGATLIVRDPAGRLWRADPDGKLSVTDPGRTPVPVEVFPRPLAVLVNEMALDREDNIWLATASDGLVRLKKARVASPGIDPQTDGRRITGIFECRSGERWLAATRGGLIRWQPGRPGEPDGSTERLGRPVSAWFEDRDGWVWLATRDGSVFRREEGEFKPRFAGSLIPSKVRVITQDDAGRMWFGGSQGLVCLADGAVRQPTAAPGASGVDVTVVRPFPGDRVIAGATNGTVLFGDAARVETLATPALTGHKWITDILPKAETEVWMATLGAGLWHWNGAAWRQLGTADGLPDPRLTRILEDDRGFFWLGSLGGIVRVARAELLASAAAPDRPIRWLRLDHEDGMPSRECLGVVQPAGWRTLDGALWFPTGGGLARVDPAQPDSPAVPPPAHLTAVLANGVAHPPDRRRVVTGPGRARLEFRFVGLSFKAPEKTTYLARLEGLDDGWHSLGSQRFVNFEAVPPGTYGFEVLAVSGDGLASARAARVEVLILPHWWQTGWFFAGAGAFVLVAAAGSGWFAARLRMRRRIRALDIRNAREAERSRIARDLHDDLGADLTELSLLTALATEDAAHSPLQAPLQQLAAKTQHAIAALDEIVWTVNPREDSLRSLADYLTAFAREFLGHAHIALRVEIPPALPEVALASGTRHAVFLAAREALNNIIKHSGASEVGIALAYSTDELAISISDNGRGFDPAAVQSGYGLGNLRSRMEQLGGQCQTTSTPGHGTTVRLTLPLPTQHRET